MTATTPPVLTLYRERHQIVPVKDWSDDLDGFVWVCLHDSLRIYPRAGGRWSHDVSEIRDLAARERGEGVVW